MFSSKSNRVRVFEVSVVVWDVLNTIRDSQIWRILIFFLDGLRQS